MAKFKLGEHFSKGNAAKVRCIRNKTSLRAFIWEISELHFAWSQWGLNYSDETQLDIVYVTASLS